MTHPPLRIRLCCSTGQWTGSTCCTVNGESPGAWAASAGWVQVVLAAPTRLPNAQLAARWVLHGLAWARSAACRDRPATPLPPSNCTVTCPGNSKICCGSGKVCCGTATGSKKCCEICNANGNDCCTSELAGQRVQGGTVMLHPAACVECRQCARM